MLFFFINCKYFFLFSFLFFSFPKKKTNFIVFSCDLITDFQLNKLCDVHRVTDATVTTLFYKPPPKTEADLAAEKARKKAGGLMDQGMNDIIAVDPSTSKLVLFDNAADLDGDELEVRTSLLRTHPCVDVHMDLLDTHIYIFNPSVLDILEEKKWISTIKGELMPYLVKKQFSSRKRSRPVVGMITRENSTPAIDTAPTDLFEGLMAESTGTPSSEELTCFSYIIKPADNILCIRANTVHLYCEANRMLPPYLRRLTSTAKTYEDTPYDFIHKDAKVDPKAMVGADAMVDAQSSIGMRCSIKRSIIGKHCTLGAKVSITNSIIMDHVTIEDECKISNSVICMNAHVTTKSNLSNCRVGVRHTVAEGSKFALSSTRHRPYNHPFHDWCCCCCCCCFCVGGVCVHIISDTNTQLVFFVILCLLSFIAKAKNEDLVEDADYA